MSPEQQGRSGVRGLLAARGRFPVFVAGAAAASLGWLLVVTLTALTPGEARERRAAPELPVPSVRVESTTLREVSWTDCSVSTQSVPVVVYGTPAGYRPVVTELAAAGSKVVTGSVLAAVAGRPIVAVVTDAPLYRDFTVGERGPDVRAFERALAAAGLIGSADEVLDAATMAAWRRLDPGADRVELDSIAEVPAGARVAEAKVDVGDVVTAGAEVLRVTAAADYYTCPGLPPDVDLEVGSLLLEVDGEQVEIDSLVRPGDTEAREGEPSAGEPGGVQVRPKGRAVAGGARLGVVSADSGGPVLAVPVTALKTEKDGQSVLVVLDGRSRRTVAVTLGATAQGLVEVSGEGLREGDSVELFGMIAGGVGG
ncbi:hypothetical protein JOD66_003925 [Nocardioides nitrophenolicus]|nr:hypothetical protein [Nocardioides nitrophenolicus]